MKLTYLTSKQECAVGAINALILGVWLAVEYMLGGSAVMGWIKHLWH